MDKVIVYLDDAAYARERIVRRRKAPQGSADLWSPGGSALGMGFALLFSLE